MNLYPIQFCIFKYQCFSVFVIDTLFQMAQIMSKVSFSMNKYSQSVENQQNICI